MDSHVQQSCQVKVIKEGSISRAVGVELRDTGANRQPTTLVERAPAPKPPPKPSIAYDHMKDAHIRKLLLGERLRTDGDKATLKRRHREWTLRYNANLDLNTPKPEDVIRAELIQWENLQAISKEASHPFRGADHENNVEVDRALESHVAKYNGQFEQMKEQMRLRKQKKTEE
ncbi:E3 ubiquitin-protein ligase rad18 [Irineochytrium annulatum]|nr:E3 ubiquitin-protein ligase rad18 [Irineochytrium annulatum]